MEFVRKNIILPILLDRLILILEAVRSPFLLVYSRNPFLDECYFVALSSFCISFKTGLKGTLFNW